MNLKTDMESPITGALNHTLTLTYICSILSQQLFEYFVSISMRNKLIDEQKKTHTMLLRPLMTQNHQLFSYKKIIMLLAMREFAA